MSSGDLLFLSPVLPGPTGSGTPMRGWQLLRALAERQAVHLLVTHGSGEPSAQLRALCASITVAPPKSFELAAVARKARRHALRITQRSARANSLLGRAPVPPRLWPSARRVREVLAAAPQRPWVAVHAFRMHTARFALAVDAPHRELDIDDVESVAFERLAAIHDSVGESWKGHHLRSDSRAWAAIEDRVVPRFQRAWVCSEGDRVRLQARFPTVPVHVAPNVVDVPPPPPTPEREPGPLRLLFVGTMGHFPNADAVRWFVSAIAPELDRAGAAWQLHLVGRGLGELLRRELRAVPDVILHGSVPALSPYYAQADVVVVPLRAGAGTRIKILEALAQRRPVVTTTLGAEGLDLTPGEHALYADDAPAFAAAVLRLRDDPALARRLADAGGRRVEDAYSAAAMGRALAGAHP